MQKHRKWMQPSSVTDLAMGYDFCAHFRSTVNEVAQKATSLCKMWSAVFYSVGIQSGLGKGTESWCLSSVRAAPSVLADASFGKIAGIWKNAAILAGTSAAIILKQNFFSFLGHHISTGWRNSASIFRPLWFSVRIRSWQITWSYRMLPDFFWKSNFHARNPAIELTTCII